LLDQGINYLQMVDELLPDAFAALVSDILFVESTVEATDQIFSFSDDSAPNVLYIAPKAGNSALAPDDLADSLLHEFLHQALYHMDAEERMLLDNVFPYFPAPWRAGLRPAAGFFHGTFVFSGLARFWQAIARNHPFNQKAESNSKRFREQAIYGIQALRQFALTTRRGAALLDCLAEGLGLSDSPISAPGILN
jgi:HEXXH motif-containing protein